MAAPPLTSFPSLLGLGHPTVTVPPVDAVLGPLTSRKWTFVVTPLTSMLSPLQIAYA
ncbi:hypothetical protein [Kitasatospora atroaurantiaca]|uniref:hypothetical protein n=1 Tax=Kitasatospora atroaurantiaca TaxID=285545 RepID=UPI0031DB21AF